jgi:hypothetical protein
MLLNIRALVAKKDYEDRRRMCQAALAPFFKPDGGRHPQPRHSVRCGGVFCVDECQRKSQREHCVCAFGRAPRRLIGFEQLRCLHDFETQKT